MEPLAIAFAAGMAAAILVLIVCGIAACCAKSSAAEKHRLLQGSVYVQS